MAHMAQLYRVPGSQVKKDFNYWMRYRNKDHVDLTPEEIAKVYRVDDSAYYPPARKPIDVTRVNLKPYAPAPDPPLTFSETEFLRSNGDRFQPIKLLGSTTNNNAGLFKVVDPDSNLNDQHVVIKQTSALKHEFTREAQYMKRLAPNGDSRHTVNLINTGDQPHLHVFEDLKTYNLSGEWLGKASRVYMEYCERGSLWDLTKKQIDAQEYLSECDLWLIFDCLADGLVKLEYGAEATVDTNGDLQINDVPGWQPIIHFDIKPQNIFIANPDTQHPSPICKIGDYGLARSIFPVPDERKISMRGMGTVGYMAPEHFTLQWNYRDWKRLLKPEAGVAGNYTPKLDVWGMGVIMTHLVMLTRNAPDITPFVPSWTILGQPATGYTYCSNLHAYNTDQGGAYSRNLTDLIYACLYDVPAQRPGSLNLKLRTFRVLQGGGMDQPSQAVRNAETLQVQQIQAQQQANVLQTQLIEMQRLQAEALAAQQVQAQAQENRQIAAQQLTDSQFQALQAQQAQLELFRAQQLQAQALQTQYNQAMGVGQPAGPGTAFWQGTQAQATQPQAAPLPQAGLSQAGALNMQVQRDPIDVANAAMRWRDAPASSEL